MSRLGGETNRQHMNKSITYSLVTQTGRINIGIDPLHVSISIIQRSGTGMNI